MSERKLWRLILTNGQTAHDDLWPSFEIVSATDEEMSQLEHDLGSRLYSASAVSSTLDPTAFRAENEWLFQDEDDKEPTERADRLDDEKRQQDKRRQRQEKRLAKLRSEARSLLQDLVDRLTNGGFDARLGRATRGQPEEALLWRVGWRAGQDTLKLSTWVSETGVEVSLYWVGTAEVLTTSGTVFHAKGKDAQLSGLIASGFEAMDHEVMADFWEQSIGERVRDGIALFVAASGDERDDARAVVLNDTGDSPEARRLIDEAAASGSKVGRTLAEKRLVKMAVAKRFNTPGWPKGFQELAVDLDKARRVGITGRVEHAEDTSTVAEDQDDIDEEATRRLAERLVEIGFVVPDDSKPGRKL